MTPITAGFPLTNLSNNLAMQAATATTNQSGTTSSTSSTDASNIGSTFLSLLTQELQNQDPTAPMDSTAMVGQMISLNQLSQLVSINQTLSGAAGTTTASAGSSTPVQSNAAMQASDPQQSANSVQQMTSAGLRSLVSPLPVSSQVTSMLPITSTGSLISNW